MLNSSHEALDSANLKAVFFQTLSIIDFKIIKNLLKITDVYLLVMQRYEFVHLIMKSLFSNETLINTD